ncbi:MAG: ABC transporter substrate-binding protein, partial [Oscillospiraceae bacterium]|nr:ABC transporter substrate-binding protein [Oscillospiraceae bacterium]
MIIVAAAMALPLFSGCSGSNTGEDFAFSYSLTSNPRNLDPQVATDNNSLLVLRNMFEGLMRLDKDGNLIPGVAREHPEHNDDYTEYTFYLREDAAWSDVIVDPKKTTTTTAPADGSEPEPEAPPKRPVTAHDFAFAWKRALAPDTGSTTCSALYCIRGAEAYNKGLEGGSA